jgi:hypothetical protein
VIVVRKAFQNRPALDWIMPAAWLEDCSREAHSPRRNICSNMAKAIQKVQYPDISDYRKAIFG